MPRAASPPAAPCAALLLALSTTSACWPLSARQASCQYGFSREWRVNAGPSMGTEGVLAAGSRCVVARAGVRLDVKRSSAFDHPRGRPRCCEL